MTEAAENPRAMEAELAAMDAALIAMEDERDAALLQVAQLEIRLVAMEAGRDLAVRQRDALLKEVVEKQGVIVRYVREVLIDPEYPLGPGAPYVEIARLAAATP